MIALDECTLIIRWVKHSTTSRCALVVGRRHGSKTKGRRLESEIMSHERLVTTTTTQLHEYGLGFVKNDQARTLL